jgi:CO dehydrogenase maturation factor
MAFHIAVAGKGGTGKTTLAALVIRHLLEAGRGPVLAVDADANANLNEALGLKVTGTIADILARVANSLEPPPAGMTKDQYLAFRVHQSLTEGDGVDLLVMGGPEGPGCYCYANNLLRGFVGELSRNYPFVVTDNEAGLEHLSRRTTQDVDLLFITSDATARGIRSAGRVRELVLSLQLEVRRMLLVVTRVAGDAVAALEGEIGATGLELVGTVPEDYLVQEFDLHGRPLLQLPPEAPAVKAVGEILKKTAVL